MYTLFNNIVSDTIHSVVCVLSGHTYDEPGFVLKTGCYTKHDYKDHLCYSLIVLTLKTNIGVSQ
jgi:hypothetical protein